MRVLLTGAAGLLGSWLRTTVPDPITVTSVVHRRSITDPSVVRADLRHPDSVDAAVRIAQPDVVIHAAYAKDRTSIVDTTEHVAAATARAGAWLVFISSDAVFAGDGRPMDEDAEPEPIQDYGRWKVEGERIARSYSDQAAIIRTSLVTSVDPPDHILRSITTASAGSEPTWFDDEYRQPVRARDLAIGIWRIVTLDERRRGGSWHLPGPERLDRLEIARCLCRAADIDPSAVVGGSAPTVTDRPRDLVLAATRAVREIGWDPSRIPGRR